jgi:glycosyltransferase involved in cell wall biosynthesis
MTLHDYFPLCATSRLLDIDGQVCTRLEIGADCVANNAWAPRDASPLVARTLRYELTRAKEAVPLLRRASFAPLRPIVEPLIARAAPAPPASEPLPPDPSLAALYQRRRAVNVERLGRIDRLIANSARTAEMYRLRGVDPARLMTMRLTLSDIEQLQPRRLEGPPRPLTLATLSGFAAPSKGSDLLLDALRRLAGSAGRFRLIAAGHIDPGAEDALRELPNVELVGEYERAQLGGILDGVDVGLLPSVCEETFGLTGVEFLAKGIPVIANARGGIAEHAHGGETGWLNGSCEGAELAAIVEHLIDHPQEVVERHRRTVELRREIVTPFGAHLDELERVYAEIGAVT